MDLEASQELGMIRSSVCDLVARCQFVTEKDKADSNSSREARESYRKIQWKQRREAARLALHNVGAPAVENRVPVNEDRPTVPVDPPRAALTDKPSLDTEDDHLEEDQVLRFDQFMHELIASDLDVVDIHRLPAVSSDPLGALSVPSRREGYSLTLCSFDSRNLLLVFGGRQLRDLTILLPVAAQDIDPLKLERVRYVFSHGVYSYDLQTTKWVLHQCTGIQPKERSDHIALFVAPHFLVVYGGRGRSGLIFDDMFVLSLQDWHWTELDTRTRPSPRYWHGACLTGDDQLFVYGGKSDVGVYDDLQAFPIGRAIDLLLRKQQQLAEGPEKRLHPPDRLHVPLAWTVPHTVGKAPSARFGLRIVRIDHDRLAFVGGWRTKEPSLKQRPTRPRCVDVYVLDTMTMVWTKPRFSSHICRLSAPPERFLFECFYTQQSLVVFGGFTYATNGGTEAYNEQNDDRHVLYKLDFRRMIWRRHLLTDTTQIALVTTAFPHFSSNAIALTVDHTHVAWTSIVRHDELPLELTAMKVRKSP